MSAFIDGSRVTPGTDRCMCDSPEPRPDGKERDCEMPCWQRLGLDMPACCPDCAPLTGQCTCGHEQCYHGDGACFGGYPNDCACTGYVGASSVSEKEDADADRT